jgi:hypothetical protein
MRQQPVRAVPAVQRDNKTEAKPITPLLTPARKTNPIGWLFRILLLDLFFERV